MLKKLWQEDYTQYFQCHKTDTKFKEFNILGKKFAYSPEDMRLFEITTEHVAFPTNTTYQPQFPLPGVTPQMGVIIPTHACNLRCKYCFADTGKNCPIISEKTIREAMQNIPQNGSSQTIAFFGGEPLIAWDRVIFTVNFARERFIKPRFSLTTNATLLTNEMVEFFARNQFSLIISIDGPEHLHDAMRPCSDGSGSYKKVIAALKKISEYPELAARTTLRGTFDGSNKHAHLLERVKHLNELSAEYSLGNVSVEPADVSEGCATGSVPVKPTESLYEEYLDLAEWFASEKVKNNNPKFHHFAVRIDRLKSRRPAPSECGAGVGYFACTPDGELHACHRLGCKVGTAEEGINMRSQAPWRDNRIYARNNCSDCWLRHVCGGGCRLNSINKCGNIKEPDPLGCWLTEVCTECAAFILSES